MGKSYKTRDYINTKLISRFVFCLNERLISYGLEKQAMIALLSTKIKYMTLDLAAQKVIWLRFFLTKFGLLQLN